MWVDLEYSPGVHFLWQLKEMISLSWFHFVLYVFYNFDIFGVIWASFWYIPSDSIFTRGQL